mgnify:CR=1 FL=1
MKWIVFMIANLIATTSFCAERQHDQWIDSLQQAAQDPLFMANLGKEEIVVELMQQADTYNSLFGQATAQGPECTCNGMARRARLLRQPLRR